MTDSHSSNGDDQHRGEQVARRNADGKAKSRRARIFATMPVILAGSLALSVGATAPAEADTLKKPSKPRVGPVNAKPKAAPRPTVAPSAVTAAAAPQEYRVAAGDTVSSIAGRFGLSTASVLAQNGLGWRSVIFPGQVLTLGTGAAAPAPSAAPASAAPASTGGNRHTVASGETVTSIAAKYGVGVSSMLAANNLGSASVIYPGQSLVVPGFAPASFVAPISNAPKAAPAAVPGGAYTIKSGDTLTSVATRFGVTVQDILNANGLNWSSIIYAGRTLTIPGPTAVATPTTSGVVPMTNEMRRNASTIVSIGRELGVSDYGIVIALAAAAQESTLRNIDFGDRDSLGLFQQRPSMGWGSRERLLDPSWAVRTFFGGPRNPNAGLTRGLLDIPNWKSMTVTQAAQAVQISAYPDAYAKWETSAWAWLDQLT
ncbi:LysM peptidoglycan-binding domain-containing protein [Microbacteriaceae bacterium 4G12]